MKKFQVSSVVALVVGLAMAIWGNTLPLHQGDAETQTTREFILYYGLSVGGILMALVAAFGMGRSSDK